ncbi:procollagen-proline 4-dioxygenase [Sarracenia purpurea var. burkii]
MKSKGKRFSVLKSKFGLPTIFLLCSLFFLAGFFGSTILSQSVPNVRSGPRLLESVEEADGSISHGETGDSGIASIPFQVNQEHLLNVNIFELGFPSIQQGTEDSGTFLSAAEDRTGILEVIEYKIARATMIPRSHGEAFNVLRYEIGQRYVSHYDTFNPAEYGHQNSQRLASFLLYLSDVEEGGETMFPYENGSNMGVGYDYEKCIGLKVKPRQGDGLLFYSLFPNGTIDKTSLHGSCPVIRGEKWVATKWIRDQEHED